MPDFLRLILGLDANAGQDAARWRIEWVNLPGGDLLFLLIMGGLAALAATVWLYFRDAKKLSTAWRMTLLSLRLLAIAIVVVMLLEPVVVFSQDENVPRRLIVLVDESASMNLTEAWNDPDQAAAVAAALELGEGEDAVDTLSTMTRRDVVQRMIELGLLGNLTDNGRRIVEVHTFAENLSGDPLTLQDGRTQLPDDPDGQVTAIGTAIDAALARYRQQPLAGMLVIGDGQSNQGVAPGQAVQSEAARDIPFAALAIGTETGPANVSVLGIDIPPTVFQRDTGSFDVTLQSRGMQDRDVVLLIERSRNGATWEPYATQTVTLGADGESQTLSFEFTEENPVDLDFRASVVAPEDAPSIAPPNPSASSRIRLGSTHTSQTSQTEDGDPADPSDTSDESPDAFAADLTVPSLADSDPSDNVQTASTSVIEPRTQVLLIAGSSFPEIQFIRNALLRDQTVEISIWQQAAEPGFPQIGDFPGNSLPRTREELDTYHAVILYDPDPDDWPTNFSQLLTDFVTKDGGGLVFISGEFYTETLFTRFNNNPRDTTSSFIDLLPVVRERELFVRDSILELSRRQPWHFDVTRDGLENPIFRNLGTDTRTGRSYAELLPGMYWHFPVSRAKPGAQVLARHGDARMTGVDGQGQVVIATQLAGPGRTFFIGFDSTYRWRYLDERVFDRFWKTIADAAGFDKQTRRHYPFDLTTERQEYAPGETVRITATFKRPVDAQGVTQLDGALEIGDQEPEPVTLTPGETPGVFVLDLPTSRAGQYTLRVTYDQGLSSSVDVRANTLQFKVVPARRETASPGLNQRTLFEIARKNPQAVVAMTSWRDVADAFDAQVLTRELETREELWDAPLFLWAVVILLTLEWLLRKRHRLI